MLKKNPRHPSPGYRPLRPVLLVLLSLFLLTASHAVAASPTPSEEKPMPGSERAADLQPNDDLPALQIHYLEIVTPDVEETCRVLEAAHGVTFGEPVAELGNARVARLRTGGSLGVRAPLRESEEPVVRPYVLVDDVRAAVEAVEAAGGQIAMAPTEIPGHGTFAIYLLGGIQHGLWER